MKNFIAFCLISVFASMASAQTSSQSVKRKKTQPRPPVQQKEKEEDADSVITNKKLRAETGSKSRFSLSTTMNYMGGSLEKPFDSKRPNIKGAAATPLYSSFSLGASIKWNITKLDSLSASLGASMIAPFENKLPEEAGGRYQVFSPSLTYQHLNKFFGVQTVFTFGSTLYTESELRTQGYLFDLGPAVTLAYDFGGSPFTVGTWISYIHRFFDKETSEVVKVGVDPEDNETTLSYLAGLYQDDYSFGVYPFIEYQINDTFNLRTLWGLWVYDHPRIEDSFTTVKRNKVYQSVGLGISITRDIYLYPNVQFIPDNVRSDRTNLALSANINLF